MRNIEHVEAAVEIVAQNTLDPEVIRLQGAGKAYQSVAQSMAIAIQDATDYQRGVMSIAQAAIAVSTELMLKQKDPETYTEILSKVLSTVNSVEKTFKQVGLDAGTILRQFPVGDSGSEPTDPEEDVEIQP